MADPTMQQVLDRLDALQVEVVSLRRQARHKRTARRFLPLALVALLVALTPLSLLAAGPFNDLNPNSVHNANIQAIADAGITKGCDPGVSYCPNGLVTREEMASFLARTAGLGTNPPVANAKTAQTAALATNSTHAGNADTATTVGGYAPNGLLRAGRTDKTSGFPAVGTSPVAIATLTLAAPTAGFVQLTETTESYGYCTTAASCTFFHYLRDEGGNGPGAAAINQHNSGSIQLSSNTQTYVFPVAAGTRTFTLFAYTSINYIYLSTLTTPQVQEAVITAIFVPFGYNGGTTLAP